MAKRKTPRQRIEEIFDKFEPAMAAAYREAIREITSTVKIRTIARALEIGDFTAALAAIDIDPISFGRLESAMFAAFEAGGMATADGLLLRNVEGARINFRFNVRDRLAEDWIRANSSQFVTNITGDIREKLQLAMQNGLREGASPISTARELVGRVSKLTGRREGGLIGLTEGHGNIVRETRQALRTNDTAGLRRYLRLERRNKRYDEMIKRAIANDKPIPRETAERITTKLSNSYLKWRGEAIARTETLETVNRGRHESFRQGIQKTGYQENQVVRRWDSAGDGKVRHSHSALNGHKARGLNTLFVSPLTGARFLYPGDKSNGAGAAEVIHCRCMVTLRFDAFGGRV